MATLKPSTPPAKWDPAAFEANVRKRSKPTVHQTWESQNWREKYPLLNKFMIESSAHGLKFVVEENRHPVERLFWLIATIFAWVFCLFMIFKIFEKWEQSPILVSFASQHTPIWEIPFPSLTICNMNKVRLSRVEHIEDELAIDPNNTYYITEKRFVHEVCAMHERFTDEDETGLHGDLDLTGEMLHEYLADLGNPCDEMILRCHFEGHDRNCSDLFIPTITDEGQCCSFNMMPESVMFRTSSVMMDADPEEEKLWSHWDMQHGYTGDPALFDINIGNHEMPVRAISPGLHMGLSIMLDVKEHEYHCAGTESLGFKALLHTPVTLPEMIEYGFAIHPGSEAFIAVSPTMMEADDSIETFSTERRQCYTQEERYLTFFKQYTFLNCFMECASNYTFKECGCVAYYMPRNPHTMPICSPEKTSCVLHSITTVEESAFENHHSSNDCKCLPSCTTIEFPHETSSSKLHRADLINIPQEILDNHPEYHNDSYVTSNLALIHIYLKHLHFMKTQRQEFFGWMDFLSNIGGLCGLWVGVSTLSVFEIIYFCTIRRYFNKRMNINEGQS